MLHTKIDDEFWEMVTPNLTEVLCSYVHASQVTDATDMKIDPQQVTNNEILGNALITAGWLRPLTTLNRNHAMQTPTVHDMLKKRQEPLDQRHWEFLAESNLIQTLWTLTS